MRWRLRRIRAEVYRRFHFADQWKWRVAIGRRRRRGNIFTKEKNTAAVVDDQTNAGKPKAEAESCSDLLSSRRRSFRHGRTLPHLLGLHGKFPSSSLLFVPAHWSKQRRPMAQISPCFALTGVYLSEGSLCEMGPITRITGEATLLHPPAFPRKFFNYPSPAHFQTGSASPVDPQRPLIIGAEQKQTPGWRLQQST